jgi:hypothetical protein
VRYFGLGCHPTEVVRRVLEPFREYPSHNLLVGYGGIVGKEQPDILSVEGKESFQFLSLRGLRPARIRFSKRGLDKAERSGGIVGTQGAPRREVMQRKRDGRRGSKI